MLNEVTCIIDTYVHIDINLIRISYWESHNLMHDLYIQKKKEKKRKESSFFTLLLLLLL